MGGVDYTNSIPCSVTNGRTDRRTDRQGQILMPPDYRHGGIKKQPRMVVQGQPQILGVSIFLRSNLTTTFNHKTSKNSFGQGFKNKDLFAVTAIL